MQDCRSKPLRQAPLAVAESSTRQRSGKYGTNSAGELQHLRWHYRRYTACCRVLPLKHVACAAGRRLPPAASSSCSRCCMLPAQMPGPADRNSYTYCCILPAFIPEPLWVNMHAASCGQRLLHCLLPIALKGSLKHISPGRHLTAVPSSSCTWCCMPACPPISLQQSGSVLSRNNLLPAANTTSTGNSGGLAQKLPSPAGAATAGGSRQMLLQLQMRRPMICRPWASAAAPPMRSRMP